MLNSLLQGVKKDCLAQGYGRKKWWADRLDVPPLTLSHWLAGRQRPSGEHSLEIRETLDWLQQDQMAGRWQDFLWDAYYAGEAIPKRLMPDLILLILSKNRVDSRTLALLSLITEKPTVNLPIAELPSIQNRIGWLLEVSGKKATFKPVRSVAVQSLLESASRSAGLEQYLKRFQTKIGKKWKIYDCPLEEIKKSLPWPRNWNE